MSRGVVFNKDRVARSASAKMDMAEIWDDTELIKMYEDSVSETYRKLEESSSKKGAKSEKWTVGARCIAPYYEDEMWYPAEITGINEAEGKAEVRFDGYGEEPAWVDLKDLGNEEDYVPDDDEIVDGEAETESANEENKRERQRLDSDRASSSSRSNHIQKMAPPQRRSGPPSAVPHSMGHGHAPGHFRSPIPSIAPPPPPAFSNLAAPSESEAHSSMLMSWYMSGYHTGYYQAIKDFEAKKGKK